MVFFMADAEAICREILSILTAPEQWTCFQTDSFNYFVESVIFFNDLRNIVYVDRRQDALGTGLCIKMHNAKVNPPKRGQEHAYCHMQSLVGELQCDIHMSIGDGSESDVMQTEIKNHVIGILPVMVGNKLAPDGPTHLPLKGHFIINGQDKVLVAQQRVINNHALLYKITSASDCVQHICEVRSTICDAMRVPYAQSSTLTHHRQCTFLSQRSAIDVHVFVTGLLQHQPNHEIDSHCGRKYAAAY